MDETEEIKSTELDELRTENQQLLLDLQNLGVGVQGLDLTLGYITMLCEQILGPSVVAAVSLEHAKRVNAGLKTSKSRRLQEMLAADAAQAPADLHVLPES